ncbi:MAG: Sec-independent protein translocase protein TatB [Sulfurimicrobium sp.]|nr:Sec-independent protein translocase protein TatB [Sulfurimicrobium sp.]
MFDIGFSELLLIGIVALVVIGPERLPKVARTAGHLFGRMQRYVADVKADINREIHAEELHKLQDEIRSSVNSIEQSVSQELSQGSQAVSEQIHEMVELPRQQITALEVGLAETLPSAEAPQPQLELNLDAPPADNTAAPARNIPA